MEDITHRSRDRHSKMEVWSLALLSQNQKSLSNTRCTHVMEKHSKFVQTRSQGFVPSKEIPLIGINDFRTSFGRYALNKEIGSFVSLPVTEFLRG
uniref:Uncharacterized protein n=1 Tax=Vespula pensylvanica TaxID=30213 RepID=A0A834P7A0_VESPE|nr:hypothetical protein H0235_004348 [Vespula pensylvanica]